MCTLCIDYIYSSPFSRCIETALQFKKYILKKYKTDVKIRIDYGLSPQIPGDWIFWLFDKASQNIQYKNGEFITKQTVNFLDNKMKSKNMVKKILIVSMRVQYHLMI